MVLEACADRDRRDHNDRAWLAHTTAYLASYHPREPGKFPALRSLQIKARTAKRSSPAKRRWQDDFALMQGWTKGRS